jgi:hypothetical protein
MRKCPERKVAESLNIPLNRCHHWLQILCKLGLLENTTAGSAFLDSLKNPAQSVDFTTTELVQTRLQQAGFRDVSVTPVPHKDDLPWNIDWMLLKARKETNIA